MVANHREIACRIIQTLRDNGIRSIAVYSDTDADAPHIRIVDMTIHIDPFSACRPYLAIDKIISVAHRCDADEIHPDYGFLSENVDFATACREADIELIGPPASVINTMGSKIFARAAVEAHDAPTAPGLSYPGLSDEDLIEATPSIGFPVLIKPSTDGDGKGMYRVGNVTDLPATFATTRREAAGALGDDSLFIEHSVDTPRRTEVQILADEHGNVIHLGEREYPLQRRHQEAIEEASSLLPNEETRSTVSEAACSAVRSVDYVGVGTIEFIVPAKDPSSFFFMKMNTRLQIEHPATEQVIDLGPVALQVNIASERPLPVTQKDITLAGHLIKARVYAEGPAAGFLLISDTVMRIVESSRAGIRADSSITDGFEVSSLYNPMLMKIASHGENREQVLERLDKALGDTVVAGVGVSTDLRRYLLSVPEVRAGDLDTGLLDRIAEGFATSGTPDDVYPAATMDWLTSRLGEATDSPWLAPDG